MPVAVTNFVPFSFPAGPSRFASGWCEEWQNGLESFLVHWSDEAVWSAAKDASRCLCAGGAPFLGFRSLHVHRRNFTEDRVASSEILRRSPGRRRCARARAAAAVSPR